MPAGFQVFLDSGVAQIDGLYRNLSVREQGSATTTSTTPNGGNSVVTFFRTGLTTPLIAVGGPTLACAQAWFDATNNRHVFIITAAGDIGTQVPYYIFDVPFDSDAHVGLQIFNDAGQKVFDSSQKYLRITDVITNIPARASTNYNYTSGRSYACIHTVNGSSISNVAGNTMMKCTSTSGESIATRGIIVDGNMGATTIFEQQATILVADVTYF